MKRSVFDPSFDKFSYELTCKSCGVQYSDHLGLTGTCQQLIEAKGLAETMNAIALEKAGQITELRADLERLNLRCAEAGHELTEARNRCEELAAALMQRDCRILELQLELGEGQ
jgi:hypothetical protein